MTDTATSTHNANTIRIFCIIFVVTKYFCLVKIPDNNAQSDDTHTSALITTHTHLVSSVMINEFLELEMGEILYIYLASSVYSSILVTFPRFNKRHDNRLQHAPATCGYSCSEVDLNTRSSWRRSPLSPTVCL